jgi:hypothetical protein
MSGRQILLEELRDLYLNAGEPSLRQVAEATGLSTSTIHGALRVKNGNPSWRVVSAIVGHLGGDVARFRQLFELVSAENHGLDERAESIARELGVGHRVQGIDKENVLVPASPNVICFWSYTHRDDLLEAGRIRRLADAIANEYELLTGERLALFVDHSEISWGDRWRDVIDSALATTALFVPVVTPLYLRSEQCRREFVEFSSRAENAGAIELVLPIIYAETPAVSDTDNDDEIAELLRTIQYVDWRKNRLSDENSMQYRTAVHEMAARLVDVISTVSARPVVIPDTHEDARPGIWDEIGEAEANAQSWHGTLAALSDEMTVIVAAVNDATERGKVSDKQQQGAKGRLAVLARLASDIATPSGRIEELGKSFGDSVRGADTGIQVVLRQAHRDDLTAQDALAANNLFEQVRELATATSEATSHVRVFVHQIDDMQAMSRLIRKPLRQVRAGLMAIIDAETVVVRWSDLTRGVQELQPLGE